MFYANANDGAMVGWKSLAEIEELLHKYTDINLASTNNQFLLFGPAGACATSDEYLRSVCDNEFLYFAQNIIVRLKQTK